MNPLFTTLAPGLFEAGARLIDRLIPDPAEREKAKLALLQAEGQVGAHAAGEGPGVEVGTRAAQAPAQVVGRKAEPEQRKELGDDVVLAVAARREELAGNCPVVLDAVVVDVELVAPRVGKMVHGGELLRQAREAAGVHIAALAVALKVPVRQIESLEQGAFDRLPDPTFTRALAASLCRQLHIDPKPILAQLPQALLSQPRVRDGINEPFHRPGTSAAAAASKFAFTPAADPAPAEPEAAPKASKAKSAPRKTSGKKAAAGVDPSHWWGALTDQFQHIAKHAMTDMAHRAQAHAATDAAKPAAKKAATKTAARKTTARKPAARKTVVRKTAAKSKR